MPSKDAPYLIPMSFGYDGNKHLYFTYFLGDSSQKQKLTKESDKARFLVYSAESVFSWESVLLTGTITELPEEDWNAHQDVLENSWRLDVFREADTVGKLKLYLFEIEESSGVRYAELPPGYNPD